jgi:hypothetical protein
MIRRSWLGLGLLLACPATLVVLIGADKEVKAPKDTYVPPRGYVCYRASGPITIDGKLDEASWAAVPWSEEFADIEGAVRPKPRQRTRMKMLWDDQNLYIAAQLDEAHVWGTLKQHDSVIFQDNDFEVFLDPDGDSHLYAELELNALNTTWDLLLPKPYRDGGKAIDGWEILGLKTAVQVDGTLNDPSDKDRGWTVEIAWPWRGLKELAETPVPPRDGDQWRINFSRVEWQHEIVDGKYRKVANTKEDNWIWSPQGVVDMHRPERWGYVQFSTAKPGSVAFRPDPTGPLRHQLQRIHEAQRDYHKAKGHWAASLDELGLADLARSPLGTFKLETTTNYYQASIAVGKQRLSIQSDGRVWLSEM